MRVWTILGAFAALIGLTGCGVPTAVTLASYAADGASFLSTGRSVTDHGISILLQKDCALFRIVRDQPVCKPMKKNDLVYDIAFAERTYAFRDPDDPAERRAVVSNPSQPVLAVQAKPPMPLVRPGNRTDLAPFKVVAEAAISPPAVPAVVRKNTSTGRVVRPSPRPQRAAVPLPPPAPGYRIVAGAFDQLAYAQSRRQSVATQLSRMGHSELGVQIARLPKGSAATYVVITRPVAAQDARDLVTTLQLDKGEFPWMLRSGRSSL